MVNVQLSDQIQALRSETANASITPDSLGGLLQKIVDVIPDDSDLLALGKLSTKHSIQCEVVGNELFVRGDVAELLSRGYIPYLFRYSLKNNRYFNKYTKDKQTGPKTKGWHPFFRSGKILVNKEGKVAIVRHSNGQLLKRKLGTSPDLYFSNIREHYSEALGRVSALYAGFGRRVYDCYYGHRFKFAIGFAPVQATDKFDFSTLITNLAPFQVYVFYDYIYESGTNVTYSI